MPENLMTKSHKSTNQAYRDGYDLVYPKPLYKKQDLRLNVSEATIDGLRELSERVVEKILCGKVKDG